MNFGVLEKSNLSPGKLFLKKSTKLVTIVNALSQRQVTQEERRMKYNN